MHRIFSIGLILLLTLGVGSAAALRAQTTQPQPQPQPQQPAPTESKKIGGTWAGAYEGDSTGKFEMSFSTTADGKETGALKVTPDDGEGYSVDLKTLSFDGSKMTATYTMPQGGDEIMMEGMLDEASLSGKWAFGLAGNPSATGTWKATKK